MTSSFDIRPATARDASELAELIYASTNEWYTSRGLGPIFKADPSVTTSLFFEVYEALDPGCCLVAVDRETDQLMGSCFYHPRDTHVSLGIMNAHPDWFGHGVARTLLEEVCRVADADGKPLRLVSSALNLDSYSLYTRAGFVPRSFFQDMVIEDVSRVPRPVSGVLASIDHAGSRLLGPGVMVEEETAQSLIANQLQTDRGGNPVFLVPATSKGLVQTLYSWGARNCELHVAQCRGEWVEPQGVVMPTFMPETS